MKSKTSKKSKAKRRNPAKRNVASGNEDAILTIIGMIPVGCVATYGQIARLAGVPRNARQVGSILKKLPSGSGVPWHRIVNVCGEIAGRSDPRAERIQKLALEEERVEFNEKGRISLAEYQWDA